MVMEEESRGKQKGCGRGVAVEKGGGTDKEVDTSSRFASLLSITAKNKTAASFIFTIFLAYKPLAKKGETILRSLYNKSLGKGTK